MRISSSDTFLIWAGGLILAYIFRAFVPGAPFDAYATAWSAGVTFYWGKRLTQKLEKFGGKCADLTPGETNGIN